MTPHPTRIASRLLLPLVAGSVLLLAAPLASAQLPSLPPVPAVPPIDTPVGSVTAQAGPTGADAQADLHAGAGTLPVPLPLPVPVPDANAAVALHAGADGIDAHADAGAAKADAHADFLGAILDWFRGLF